MNMILAHDEDYGIGYKNELLYHFPKDLKRFKKITKGQNIIMGRKTWDSLPFKLPNRKHIVLSRCSEFVNTNKNKPDIITDNIKYIFSMYSNSWIIGGASLYINMIEFCDRVEITRIKGSKPNDTNVYELKDILDKKFLIESISYLKDIDSISGDEYDIEFISYVKR